jgi:thiol-disulfide isomerase/thioredoxin
MKLRSLLAGLALALFGLSGLTAQQPAPAPSPAAADLEALVTKITVKIQAGETSATALAPELAEFAALQAKYQGQKNGDVAQIALMRAMLYAQVIEDEATARKLLLAVKTDFPGTEQAAAVDSILSGLDQAARAKATLAKLIGSPAPALNFNWSSQDGLKTLADLKGRVVVLDFWATWCGPCLSSFPQVREHVAHFKGSPVTILGVTSIQGMVANLEPGRIDTKGDPARERSLMPAFMKAKEMTWPVVFSEEPVFNPDYGVQGIPFIAIIAPDGTVRHAGLNPHDPSADITGKVTALLKEFKLPLPGAKS